MKVAILVLAVTFAGVLAQETTTAAGPPPFVCDSDNSFVCTFKELGHNIKYHAGKLGNSLKTVGQAVLSSALDQGKNLLVNGAQATLGTILEHLTKEGLVGKREIGFFDSVKAHVKNGFDMLKKAKEKLHAVFSKAVEKLTGSIKNIAGLKKIEENADKEIDGAVEEFKKENKKGFVAMAAIIAKKLHAVMAEGMQKIKQLIAQKKDTRAILGFNSLSEAWEKAKQHLANVGKSLSDTFKPHIDTLKKGISSLADQAKMHAGNLAAAATSSFNDLKKKLSTHVDTLKGHVGKLGEHATNAVNALKEAISAIAVQAVNNAKDTVGDIVKTGTDAAGVVKDHVSDSLAG